MYTYIESLLGWDIPHVGHFVRVSLTRYEVNMMIESLVIQGGGHYIVLDCHGNILQRGEV